MQFKLQFVVLLPLLLALGCKVNPRLDVAEDVPQRLAQFAPTEISADISFLPENEQQALDKLIEASRYMDDIFLRQVWAENPEYRDRLYMRTDSLGEAGFEFFKIMFGPWDRTDEHEAPFVGDPEKPLGAGYYPSDMSQEEFDAFLEANPDSAEKFKSLHTIIKRANGSLTAVPYSIEYREFLQPAATLMREAADLTANKSLQKFLRSRADAFFTDDYQQSDIDWMDLQSPIEITIGPYETYEDKLFGFKAAFESFVTVTDPAESEKLALYKAELPAMERNLPIPDGMKNLDRGSESPIRVVDEVFTAGDTKAGVQTIAFNLPNDETVREMKGSKKVLLRNVIAAKYESILKPIAQRVVAEDQVPLVTAEAFTNEVLFHELAHGLGPGKIEIDGRETEVRFELKDLYSPLEEAKADIMGVYNMHLMIDKEILPSEMKKQIAVTYLAGLFRGIRFGIGEAHGKGNALQFNYMLEKGAVTYDAEANRFAIDFAAFEEWTRELVQDICILQAAGDYNGTQEMFDKYVTMPESLNQALATLGDVPVDIRPTYPLAMREEDGGTN